MAEQLRALGAEAALKVSVAACVCVSCVGESGRGQASAALPERGIRTTVVAAGDGGGGGGGDGGDGGGGDGGGGAAAAVAGGGGCSDVMKPYEEGSLQDARYQRYRDDTCTQGHV